jgi:hypothetical protein
VLVPPCYRECLARRRPTYSISRVEDPVGKEVSCERLLLSFGEDDSVRQIVGSYKAISIDGGFKVDNLMDVKRGVPTRIVNAAIDLELGRARLRRYHCYRHWPILPRRHLHVRFMLKHRAMRETHHPRQHRRVLALVASAPSTLQPVHYRKTAPSPTRPRPHFLVMPGTAAQQRTCRNIRIGPDMLDERPPNYHV